MGSSTDPGLGTPLPSASLRCMSMRRHAAILVVTRGQPGIYNIAEEDGVVAIEKARAELGFDPHYRLDCDLLR
jgi:hypothetical protein